MHVLLGKAKTHGVEKPGRLHPCPRCRPQIGAGGVVMAKFGFMANDEQGDPGGFGGG